MKKKKTILQHVIEGIEDYFYLGGKSAYAIPDKIIGDSQEVILKDKDQNKYIQVISGAIKIISYMMVLHQEYRYFGVVPLLILTAKVIFRATHKFHKGPITNSQTSSIAQNKENNVASLMDLFTNAWDDDKKKFILPPNFFNLESFTEHLSKHAEQFKKEGVTNDQHFGYIEKFDLNPSDNPQIYMRADLHGDLKSLIENIRSLQEQGLLDENFKCKPGVHLVFLGDYCDRGIYGTEILELLMRLREENPEQIHLIRGNHEYILMNGRFGNGDINLMKILSDQKTADTLERFYETMSLTTYFSVNQRENREYVQCTHGLFEPTMDPTPLIDQAESGAYLAVPKERKLSERVRKIADSNSKLSEAAKQIHSLIQESKNLENDITAYNWADVSEDDESIPGSLANRIYALSARDIRYYLDLSSEQHRVMMIFRGHQHAFQHLMYEDKVLATTLPVGMDSPYKGKFDQPDRAYIIKPQTQVENWKKRAILRENGQIVTDEITSEFSLTSSSI